MRREANGEKKIQRYSRRKRINSGRIAVLTLLFWVVSGLVMISFIHGGPGRLIEGKSNRCGKNVYWKCISFRQQKV